jgi:hypothetical protein
MGETVPCGIYCVSGLGPHFGNRLYGKFCVTALWASVEIACMGIYSVVFGLSLFEALEILSRFLLLAPSLY